MEKASFRFVFQHDLTYAAEIAMPDRTVKSAKGFASSTEAEMWVAEQQGSIAAKVPWVRRPTLDWRERRSPFEKRR